MALADPAASPQAVAAAYFEAFGRRDAEGMAALWADDGYARIVGRGDLTGPGEVAASFAALFATFPDLEARVRETIAQGESVAVHWHAVGTFAGEPLDGMEATGARVRLEGVDLLRIRDGRIVRNDAYVDGLGLARQIGALPPAGSPADRRLTGAFNARTRLVRRLASAPAERVAEGVWLLRGGLPTRIMHVYAIEDDGGGVTLFDAGIEAMTSAVAAFGARMGSINRIVLGHAHEDHRGAAPGLGAPVFCHPLDRADAEGDGGRHYMHLDRLNPSAASRSRGCSRTGTAVP